LLTHSLRGAEINKRHCLRSAWLSGNNISCMDETFTLYCISFIRRFLNTDDEKTLQCKWSSFLLEPFQVKAIHRSRSVVSGLTRTVKKSTFVCCSYFIHRPSFYDKKSQLFVVKTDRWSPSEAAVPVDSITLPPSCAS
jgi:hypothetical protein